MPTLGCIGDVPVDRNAFDLVHNFGRIWSFHDPVAVMPEFHPGMGAMVG